MRQLLLGIGLCLFYFHTHAQSVLEVRVTDAGIPIPGAQVNLSGRLATTNDAGMATIEVPTGEYQLEVTSAFYESKRQSVSLRGGRTLLEVVLVPIQTALPAANVAGILARPRNPIAFTEMDKSAIDAVNEGRDIPFILEQTPGLVTTSDAGAGIGYTGMRIRGSDQTRINVTVNGVPINDAESHGVFWVNMPDLASSVDKIQVQRGIGTSTNGAGAFGASVHLETSGPRKSAYTELDAVAGSFNTNRLSLRFGTGLMDNGFSFDGRLSRIQSDGYIDRASSDLQSYYFNLSKVSNKTTMSIVAFGGHQRTYQAWYGIDPTTLETNPTFNPAGNIPGLSSAGEQLYYDNQVDDYRQNHYQFLLNHRISLAWKFNAALHYTYGVGFYEEYRSNRRPSEFGMPNLTRPDTTPVSRTDYTRRLWLRNHFAGAVYSLVYDQKNTRVTFGGAGNYYTGDHFGDVLWVSEVPDLAPFEFYNNIGTKTDLNQFVKAEQTFGRWDLFADMQARLVQYNASGLNRNMSEIDISEEFLFLNPKLGASFQLTKESDVFVYAGMAGREPTRRDLLEANIEGFELRPEHMRNIEMGYRLNRDRMALHVNAYLMDYRDQLVLTGELSDTGRPLRRNVGRSHRYGLEGVIGFQLLDNLRIDANAALSRNRNRDWSETVAFDEADTPILNNFGNTPIALSPDLVAGSMVTYSPVSSLSFTWSNRYVSKQYLNNLGREDLALPAYWINDLRVQFVMSEQVSFRLFVNNIFGNQFFFDNIGGRQFASNGGTFNFPDDNGQVQYGQFIFPQATTNFLIGVSVRL
jgi:iron complex outermembrane recepter protein